MMIQNGSKVNKAVYTLPMYCLLCYTFMLCLKNRVFMMFVDSDNDSSASEVTARRERAAVKRREKNRERRTKPKQDTLLDMNPVKERKRKRNICISVFTVVYGGN